MSEPPSRSTIALAGIGALACIGLILAITRYPGTFEQFMQFGLLSVVAIALAAAAFDWAMFEGLINVGIVAHGEREPRYRDYAGLRLACLAVGAVAAFAGASERWQNDIIVKVGWCLLIGSHAYLYWAVIRDVAQPKSDKH